MTATTRPDATQAHALTTAELKQLAKELDLQTDLATAILPLALLNLTILDRKQQDYGRTNLTEFGVFGVVVRMNDKMQRLKHLTERGAGAGAQFEPIKDTLLDLANYAYIAYAMHALGWPKGGAS
jgi:hypothetical protein